MKIMFLLIASIAFLTLANTREIQLPAIYDYNVISVKLGVFKIVQQPQFEFSKVYKRWVMKVEGNQTQNFDACVQNKPQIEFNLKDQVVFKGIPSKSSIIYNFEDIRYSQFLLGIYYADYKAYIMFKNGKAAVITLKNDERIKSTRMLNVKGLPAGKSLQVGYFIKVGKDILFVNNQVAIRMTDTEVKVLEGYEGYSDFESVIALEKNLFAVANSTTGIYIYDYNGKKVEKITEFKANILNPSNVRKLQLADMVYYKTRKILITVDYVNGVQTYDVIYTNDEVTLKAGSSINKLFGCYLAYLYESTLYVACAKTFAYDFDKWPTITLRRLPYPNVEIKEIYEVDDLVAFVGRNSFSMLYLGRMVNYFEDGNLDKLLFSKNLYISANEEGLDIGQIKVIKPYITCTTRDKNNLGLSHLVFKTVAQCNETYLEKYQINKSLVGQVGPDDKCIYTVYRPINYWEIGEIKTYPFIGAIIVMVVAVLILLGIFLIKGVKIRRMKQMIEQYSTHNINSQSAKHYEIAEELDGGISSATNTVNIHEVQKATEVQLAEKMEDAQR